MNLGPPLRLHPRQKAQTPANAGISIDRAVLKPGQYFLADVRVTKLVIGIPAVTRGTDTGSISHSNGHKQDLMGLPRSAGSQPLVLPIATAGTTASTQHSYARVPGRAEVSNCLLLGSQHGPEAEGRPGVRLTQTRAVTLPQSETDAKDPLQTKKLMASPEISGPPALKPRPFPAERTGKRQEEHQS